MTGATRFRDDLGAFENHVSGMALATGSSFGVKHRRLAPCRSLKIGQSFLERLLIPQPPCVVFVTAKIRQFGLLQFTEPGLRDGRVEHEKFTQPPQRL